MSFLNGFLSSRRAIRALALDFLAALASNVLRGLRTGFARVGSSCHVVDSIIAECEADVCSSIKTRSAVD